MDVLFKHAKQLAPEVGRTTSHLGKWDRPMNVPRLFDEALTFVQISARSRCLGSFSNQLELKYTDRYRSTDSSEPLITPGKYCSQTCTESSFSSVVWPSMAHCLAVSSQNSARQIIYEVSCPLTNWYELLLCG